MNADEYLNRLIEKNPAIGKPDDEHITLTCRGLRNIIRQAHKIGYEDCKETEELMRQFFRRPKSDPFDSNPFHF